MMFRVIDCAQRTPEWFQARCGRVTASAARSMLATVSGGNWAASRKNLRVKLLVERLTGVPQEDGYQNDAMLWGENTEPDGRSAYQVLTGNLVTEVGFLAHYDVMAGASPDGVIGDFEGLVEIKCPTSATHWGYLRNNLAVPAEHMAQLTHLLWLTGCHWIDFFSFDPRFPKELQTFCKRLHRSEVDIEAYAKALHTFLEEVDREIAAAKGWSILAEAPV